MPIRPKNADRYPADWEDISRRIRFDRAGGRCECRGECGHHHGKPGARTRCKAYHGQPQPLTGSTVVLTTMHLDHQPENCDPANLLAGCQFCHLNYDKLHHAETRLRSMEAAGQGKLGL